MLQCCILPLGENASAQNVWRVHGYLSLAIVTASLFETLVWPGSPSENISQWETQGARLAGVHEMPRMGLTEPLIN